MRLDSPLDLLWLVPLVGGIIALYLLKKRRREVTVPSLYLWEAIIQSVQADTPLQKLRPTLLLFLQLLTAFLLIFALARPYLLGSALAGRDYAIIIDNGARMDAADIAPSRLAQAKGDAQKLVAALGARDRALVIAAGAQPALLCPLTSDRGRLSDAVSEIPATDTPSDLAGALIMARAALGRRSALAQAVVYSDGGGDPAQIAQAAGPLATRFVTIATSDPANAGIVAMDFRRDLENPASGYQLFIALRNFGPDSIRSGRLTVSFAGHAVGTWPLKMAADGGGQAVVAQSPAFRAGGVATASLEGVPEDSLASDNTAWVVIPPIRARKALLVTTGDVFLEKGLNLDPDIALYEVAPKDFATLGHNGEGYDLVVFDDYLPASLPPGRYLVFHAVNAQMPVRSLGADSKTPSVLDWDQTNPIMRFVDLSDLTVGDSARAQPADWGTTLAEADSGPLIVSGANAGSRVVWLAFSPPDSNFGMRISFPIFLTNAVEWLMQDSSSGAGSIHAGEPIVLPHPGVWTIAGPGGSLARVNCAAGDSACSYTGASRVGLYTAADAGQKQVYAVDLASETLSDLAPHAPPSAGAADALPESRAPAAPAHQAVWPWVAAAALALLAIEWLAYHRRL